MGDVSNIIIGNRTISASPIKFEDICGYIFEETSINGSKPSLSQIMRLANQALDMFNIRDQIWSNSGWVSGSNSYPLPSSCSSIKWVKWNGDLLIPTEEYYATKYPSDGVPGRWYSDGQSIILDTVPDSVSDGVLTWGGDGTVGHFSNVSADPNPLDYFDLAWAYAPAYYVLANLPIDYNDKAQLMKRQDFENKWKEAYSKQMSTIRKRKGKPFSYKEDLDPEHYYAN